jgi:pyruvate kinase
VNDKPHIVEPHFTTRVVASLGPTLSTEADIIAALELGAAFRQPFGYRAQPHFDQFACAFQNRERLRQINATVSGEIYVDLPSERPRIGHLHSALQLHPGQVIRLVATPGSATSDEVPIPALARFVTALQVGHRVLLRDGNVVLRIAGVRADASVTAEVEHAAQPIDTNNNLMFPDSAVRFDPIVDEDRALLARYRQAGYAPDWVMLSLIASVEQVRRARAELREIFGDRAPRVMVKIETAKSVEGMRDLLDVADGLLVGRGDLGMTTPPERIPAIQAEVVNACREAGKPVLVATEFLQRYAETGVPNRAELSDVALAVRQHVSGIVLTKETSSSPHALDAIRLARRIIEVETR